MHRYLGGDIQKMTGLFDITLRIAVFLMKKIFTFFNTCNDSTFCSEEES